MSSPPRKHPRRTQPPVDIQFVGSFGVNLPQPSLPEVAIAGRSNVGKSSAINALLGRTKAARTSKTPGRTQAVNLFQVDGRFMLADLPGYGFARVPPDVQARWKHVVESYLGGRRTLRLVVVLVDARHEAQAMDQELVGGLRAAGIPFKVVATKVDQVRRSRRERSLAGLARGLGIARGSLFPFSSMTGEGVDALWSALLEAST